MCYYLVCNVCAQGTKPTMMGASHTHTHTHTHTQTQPHLIAHAPTHISTNKNIETFGIMRARKQTRNHRHKHTKRHVHTHKHIHDTHARHCTLRSRQSHTTHRHTQTTQHSHTAISTGPCTSLARYARFMTICSHVCTLASRVTRPPTQYISRAPRPRHGFCRAPASVASLWQSDNRVARPQQQRRGSHYSPG